MDVPRCRLPDNNLGTVAASILLPSGPHGSLYSWRWYPQTCLSLTGPLTKMNSSPARVEILWPKQVIWLPRPQIKLVWFNFRFGAIQQSYITADIFHYPAKAGGGRDQGCTVQVSTGRHHSSIVMAHIHVAYTPFLPATTWLFITRRHIGLSPHLLMGASDISIVIVLVRDDVNSTIAAVSERKCVYVC